MLFDCVISWLYMCVLQLTLGKLIYANFPQFFTFSMWSVRTASLCIQTGVDQTAGRYSCTSERARLRRLNGQVRRPDAHEMSACFRGNAHPNGVNKPSGRGPTGSINPLATALSPYPTKKSLFWLLVSDFLWVFGIILPFLVFLCITLSFQLFY
jgi:hypothetical protein